jgi:hypothetical protein
VKHLLYTEKYTIEGAKRRLDDLRKAGELKPSAREALEIATWQGIENELREILRELASPAGASR